MELRLNIIQSRNLHVVQGGGGGVACNLASCVNTLISERLVLGKKCDVLDGGPAIKP